MSDGFLEDDQLELSELINATVDRGVVVHGGVTLAVADIDLIKLDLGLMLVAVETVLRKGGGDFRSLALELGTLDLSGGARLESEQPPSPGFGGPGSVGPSTAPSHLVSQAPPSGPGPTAAVASPGAPPKPASPPLRATTELSALARGLPERINADSENVENGLARLVLTLVEVLRKVLEHQAVRRMDGGTLSDAEVERLGIALLRLSDRVRELKGVFGLRDEDLEVDLGPLGRLR